MAQARLLGNRYRLDSVVGRGGMGTVWRAFDVMLDRDVAVKEVLLPPGLSDSERAVLYERTFREARASARLNHPGVVTVHDVVEEAGSPWIVMELVLAPSLQDLLERGPMEHRRVAGIGLQMLGALRHAHEKGILHRDIKPSNVLITDTGRVVLTDFGIAQVEGDATLTQTGLVMGSPAYIPPERAQGERAVPASDLWALGATLYAAVEGRSPYERSDAMASLQAALTEPVPPARNAGPLARVLDGLLAREPVHRMTAAQAQPLLTRVAALLPPPSRRAAPAEETLTDEPPSRFLSTRTDDASETILDPAELDSVTRQDPGDLDSVTRSDPEGEGPVTRRDPGRSGGRGGSSPHNEPGRSGGHGGSRSQHEPARFRQPDQNGSQHRSMPPVQDTESRTFRQTEWAPPPSQSQPSHGPQPGQQGFASPPQTPPPWEQPQQFTNWQQPSPPVHGIQGLPGAGGRGERRKTVVIVTVAVILVVAAVLVGAFILRGKLQPDATARPAPTSASAALGAH